MIVYACDCPTCPERGFVVEVTGVTVGRRCPVCGWLMRHLDADEEANSDAS